MKTITPMAKPIAALAGACLLSMASLPAVAATGCAASTNLAATACRFSVRDDYHTERAICLHSPNDALNDCLDEAFETAQEGLEECQEIRAARYEVCESFNDGPHEPEFGEDYADNFIDPRTIGSGIAPNPYFPLVPGNSWKYSGTFEEDGEEITEIITITVTDKVKLIDGILCLVVRDVVEVDEELVEDTDDWFAQDVDGNIWYCGEEVKDYETFEGDVPPTPELVSDDGSFKISNDDEKGGVLLPSSPVAGQMFRQELVWSEAEDIIEILDVNGTESVPATTCVETCLVTRDFSPLDPGVEENKYYAPGIGKILEIDLESGARFELVDYVVN